MSKRRANGEGSITRRKDGRYMARVSLPTGHRKCFYGKTRAEVAAKLTDALKATQDGMPLPSEVLTVGGFLEDWLAGHKAVVRPRTWTTYDYLVSHHVLPKIGRVRLARLTPAHLRRVYAELLEALSPSTVRQVHAVLGRAFKDAVNQGNMARNVVRMVRPPRVERVEVRPLNLDEANVLLSAARGHRLQALYVLALTTGLRQGELLALRWADLDLTQSVLQVRFSLLWGADGHSFRPPKSKRSRRRVSLTSLAVAALREHRARQAEERLALGGAWTDLDLVFPTCLGTPQRPANLRRSFRALLVSAGVRRVRFHDMRHTAATLLLLKGVHVKVVSELLGHSTIALTLDTYSHVLPDMQAQATAATRQADWGAHPTWMAELKSPQRGCRAWAILPAGGSFLLSPDTTGNQFDIRDITPHPFVMDTWFVAPFVDVNTQTDCIKDYVDPDGDGVYEWTYDFANVYTACSEPEPFIIQRRPPGTPPGWSDEALPIAGLPSLNGNALSTWYYTSGGVLLLDQLIYGTTGSGAFRGEVAW